MGGVGKSCIGNGGDVNKKNGKKMMKIRNWGGLGRGVMEG